ncbi:Uncharacterized protein FWK35_00008555 [Aphis craccivora]|uniref:Uncharacterized protein n=1 Tax=Aphis craccivora TaxID=307492 RepID=A0A6G0ZI96_APHCR|nr:Uncharacterized protein FWK35_00008555 [Aphis craccivora]
MVHLVSAVIGSGAGVIRRSLARARVHGLDLLLIVSLIVATAARSEYARTADTDSTAAGLHLLVATTSTTAAAATTSTSATASAATTADVLSVLTQVIGVMRGVVVLMLVVMMLMVRAAEKVRRTHVVLHVAVIVRRRVLGLRHHHLVHLRRLMVRKRVVGEKRVHRWRIQHTVRCNIMYTEYKKRTELDDDGGD